MCLILIIYLHSVATFKNTYVYILIYFLKINLLEVKKMVNIHKALNGF